MIRYENGKLIIEVKTDDPAETITDWKSAILDALKFFKYDEVNAATVVYGLIDIIENISPSDEQLALMLNTSNNQ
jgi:hypothetical protein